MVFVIVCDSWWHTNRKPLTRCVYWPHASRIDSSSVALCRTQALLAKQSAKRFTWRIDILFGSMGQPSEAIGDNFSFVFPCLPWLLNTHGVCGGSVFKRCWCNRTCRTQNGRCIYRSCNLYTEFITMATLQRPTTGKSRARPLNWPSSHTKFNSKVPIQADQQVLVWHWPILKATWLSSRDWENFAPKGSDGADSFPGANIIAIPEGIGTATEQWDSSIAQNHMSKVHINGAHPFSGLSTLNIFALESSYWATDTEDNFLNMLVAVKDDAALHVQSSK